MDKPKRGRPPKGAQKPDTALETAEDYAREARACMEAQRTNGAWGLSWSAPLFTAAEVNLARDAAALPYAEGCTDEAVAWALSQHFAQAAELAVSWTARGPDRLRTERLRKASSQILAGLAGLGYHAGADRETIYSELAHMAPFWPLSAAEFPRAVAIAGALAEAAGRAADAKKPPVSEVSPAEMIGNALVQVFREAFGFEELGLCNGAVKGAFTNSPAQKWAESIIKIACDRLHACCSEPQYLRRMLRKAAAGRLLKAAQTRLNKQKV
ncbi:hypothetical protein [Acidocella facilis]|uniref:hypothetical protein n=1 Tax=Acidocella facilis TaxID=525 RepID=UPI001F42F521|nr:hypothetical protein [Acidocella facilis]